MQAVAAAQILTQWQLFIINNRTMAEKSEYYIFAGYVETLPAFMGNDGPTNDPCGAALFTREQVKDRAAWGGEESIEEHMDGMEALAVHRDMLLQFMATIFGEEPRFFVCSPKHSGNQSVWTFWRANGAGYTDDLQQAGEYTGTELRDSWPIWGELWPNRETVYSDVEATENFAIPARRVSELGMVVQSVRRW